MLGEMECSFVRAEDMILEIKNFDQNISLREKYFFNTRGSVTTSPGANEPGESLLRVPLLASVVFQREWGITNGTSTVTTLMTEGIGKCIAVLVYHRKSQTAILGHSDISIEPDCWEEILEEAKLSNPCELEVTLIGGHADEPASLERGRSLMAFWRRKGVNLNSRFLFRLRAEDQFSARGMHYPMVALNATKGEIIYSRINKEVEFNWCSDLDEMVGLQYCQEDIEDDELLKAWHENYQLRAATSLFLVNDYGGKLKCAFDYRTAMSKNFEEDHNSHGMKLRSGNWYTPNLGKRPHQTKQEEIKVPEPKALSNDFSFQSKKIILSRRVNAEVEGAKVRFGVRFKS